MHSMFEGYSFWTHARIRTEIVLGGYITKLKHRRKNGADAEASHWITSLYGKNLFPLLSDYLSPHTRSTSADLREFYTVSRHTALQST